MINTELRYFLTVAGCGSLSAASQQLYVATSAISRQIQRLETRLGVALFTRHARGMELTDAGRILENHVRKTLSDMDHAVAQIQGLTAIRRVLMRIACTDGLAFDLLPGLIARFRQQHPGVTFDLQVGSAMQVAQWVRNGSCDLAFQFCLAPEREVDILATWPAPVLLLTAPGHPLVGKRVHIEALQRYPLVLPEPDSTLRQLFDLSCRSAGVFLEPTLSTNRFSAQYAFTLTTPQGMSVCSHFSVLWRASQGELCLLAINNDTLSQRSLQIQAPMGRHRATALTLFSDFARQQIDAEHQACWQRLEEIYR